MDVTTLRTWLHRAQQPSSDSETLTPSEAKELAQLRREVSVLKMERDIYKKAATFFAKETCFPVA